MVFLLASRLVRKATGRGAVNMGGIRGRAEKIKAYIREYMPEANFLLRLVIFLDVIWASWFYGGAIDDYFRYNFFLRSHADRKNFIVWRKRKRIINSCNKKEDRDIFNIKSRFNEIFAAFVGRDWLNTAECSFEDFASFLSRNERFFVKPVAGSFGLGVRVQDTADYQDMQGLFHSLCEEKVLVEEVIEQWAEMAEFNPTSVNTLRIVTLLCVDGTAKVMTATLRCGNGDKCADNFHHNGIASMIDIPTGVVTSTGVDMESRRYVLHPVSEKPFVGFKIPFWDKILATVTAAAQVVPTVRYVGWDVALGNDGRVIIVEGNSAADPDVTQMPDQVGKWPLYKNELRKLAGLRPGKSSIKKGRESFDKTEPALFQEGDSTIA